MCMGACVCVLDSCCDKYVFFFFLQCLGIWVCTYNFGCRVYSKNWLDKSSCCQICAFSLKCKSCLYSAATCGLIGQPFILSLQAFLNIPVSLFLSPFCLLGSFLPSGLPFAILSVLSCIQFLISLSLSLCVPLLCASHSHLLVWLRLRHPRGHVFSIYYKAKEGREEWANEGGWNRGTEIHTAYPSLGRQHRSERNSRANKKRLNTSESFKTTTETVLQRGNKYLFAYSGHFCN